MDSVLMDVREVATYLNLKPSKVRSMVFRKEIPYLKIGRLVRFRRQDLDTWLGSIAKRVDSYRPPVLKEGVSSIFDSSILNSRPVVRRSA